MQYNRIATLLLFVIAAFLAGFVIQELQVILLPFVVASLLSVVLQPVVHYLRDHRLPSVLAIVVVLAVMTLFGFLFSMVMSSTIKQFLLAIPRYETMLDQLIDRVLTNLEALALTLGLDADELSNPISFGAITEAARRGVNTFISFASSVFLILLFMLFMLMGAGESSKKIHAAFPGDMAQRIVATTKNIGAQVRRYLITKTLISLITGVLTFGVLWIMGVDFPLIWGFVAFLFNYVPNIGSMFAVILPTILGFLQFDTFLYPFFIGCLLTGVQLTMGNVIEPRIMALSLNISPILVLLSLIFWGWLWGVWGMVLAVPLTVTIKIIMENIDTLRPFSILMSRKAPDPTMHPGDGAVLAEIPPANPPTPIPQQSPQL